jgi:hypothetical protein
MILGKECDNNEPVIIALKFDDINSCGFKLHISNLLISKEGNYLITNKLNMV